VVCLKRKLALWPSRKRSLRSVIYSNSSKFWWWCHPPLMGPRPAQISSVLEMLGYQTKRTELNLQHMEITWVFSKYISEWHSQVLTEAHKSPSYCWLAQVIISYSVSASKILLLHRCSTVYVHRCVLAVIKRNYMAGFCSGPFKRWSKINLHWQKESSSRSASTIAKQ